MIFPFIIFTSTQNTVFVFLMGLTFSFLFFVFLGHGPFSHVFDGLVIPEAKKIKKSKGKCLIRKICAHATFFLVSFDMQKSSCLLGHCICNYSELQIAG